MRASITKAVRNPTRLRTAPLRMPPPASITDQVTLEMVVAVTRWRGSTRRGTSADRAGSNTQASAK